MAEIAPWRLNLLRCTYLLLVAGLGLTIWPQIFHHPPWTVAGGVVHAMLAALSALAILGLRQPLKMLPLLLFELAWKAIWLTVVALPLWRAHQLGGDQLETAYECLTVVVMLPMIPWDRVAKTYLAAPSEAWRMRLRRPQPV